ncbi:uncharacterized protein TNCV_2266611 [Trichonephila clavipes]|nr:uncharacterized protein TNCV_2266611 [Trichonephila clavipes]
MLAQRLARDTLPTATPDQLLQYVEAAWTVVPQRYIQSIFDSMPRSVAAVTANNGGCTHSLFCHHPHVTRGCNFNRLVFVQLITCQINFAVISLVLLVDAFCVASSVLKGLEKKI